MNREIIKFVKNRFLFIRNLKWIIGPIKNKKIFHSLKKNIFFLLKQKKTNIIFIHLQEHIGDIVACEPVSRYAKNKYPNYKVCWVINYKYISLVKCNKNIDYILPVTCIFEWIILRKLIRKNNNFKIIDLHINGRQDIYFPIKLHNPNKHGITLDNYYDYGTLLEAFSLAANLPKLGEQPIFYFCKKPIRTIKDKYIVVHCSSNEEERNWDTKKWNELAKYLIEKGFTVVEIGLNNIITLEDKKYINYCGKKDFQEIAEVIYFSELFIGIDSGFAHFANALKIPSIILLGHYRKFKKYLPYTGFLKENKDLMIIQYNGKVKDIPNKLVIDKIEKVLSVKEEGKICPK